MKNIETIMSEYIDIDNDHSLINMILKDIIYKDNYNINDVMNNIKNKINDEFTKTGSQNEYDKYFEKISRHMKSTIEIYINDIYSFIINYIKFIKFINNKLKCYKIINKIIKS
jgi:lipid A disaccharide synthetase